MSNNTHFIERDIGVREIQNLEPDGITGPEPLGSYPVAFLVCFPLPGWLEGSSFHQPHPLFVHMFTPAYSS